MHTDTSFNDQVNISSADTVLNGKLLIPDNSRALVIFVDDSGSSLQDPRNLAVAKVLQQEGFATLLFDLMTPEERSDRGEKLDIHFIAERIRAARKWAEGNPQTEHLNVGIFAYNTGVASAVLMAADPENRINAIVSLSGRPDLVLNSLEKLQAPMLLIVGGADNAVVTFNQKALPAFHAESALRVLQDSGHGFENSDKLMEVAYLSRDWFVKHI
jgi:dienelactone hydrolase